jgi:glycosyltransferase involved in cell wall biosynthesis
MINNFTIIWSFRNRINLLKRSIKSAHETTPLEIDFCLVDAASSDETIRELREFCNTIKNRKIRICESSYRTTLSEAWNLGLMLSSTNHVVFASSDIHFLSPKWCEIIQTGIQNGSQYLLLQNHSVFMVDKKIIPKMGWFDESFGLGPHFDVDFMIRASENGVEVQNQWEDGIYSHNSSEEETNSFHNDISVTDRVGSEINDRLPMNDIFNEIVFKEKWESSWAGWTPNSTPHPPTHISQVKRIKQEIDPHPLYTKKFV